MDTARLQFLLHRYVDQALSDGERAELEQMLLASPEARRFFWDFVGFHAQLRQFGEEQLGAQLAQAGTDFNTAGPSDVPASSRIIPLRFLWTGLAAAACAMLLAGWFYFGRAPKLQPSDFALTEPTAEEFTNGVARITRAVDVAWNRATNLTGTNGLLLPGTLEIASGAVQIDFFNGAVCIVEGPAQFEIMSRQQALLRAGSVSVHVPPPARGFKVATPGVNVLDLGTRFGIAVTGTNSAEVHVLEGEVALAPRGATTRPRKIREKRAVLAETNQIRAIPMRRAVFLTAEDLARREAELIQQQIERWRAHARLLDSDRAMIAHFTAENWSPSQNILTNTASSAQSHGEVVGCRSTTGRWPGTAALRFEDADDRVRVQMPNQLNAFTLVLWARVDSMPTNYTSLLMTDQHRPGAVHWALSVRGEMRSAVLAERTPNGDGNWSAAMTPPLFDGRRRSRWTMLAMVSDGKRISSYVDGRLVASEALPSEMPFVFGRVELGNWSVTPENPQFRWAVSKQNNFFHRAFRGSIDEFIALSRAMRPEEIASLYESGKPPKDLPTVLAEVRQSTGTSGR
jgi:hypothetical protein